MIGKSIYIIREKVYSMAVCEDEAQVITLLGAILAVGIILIAGFSSQVATVGGLVPVERSSSLLVDFFNVKNAFAAAFNASVDDIGSNSNVMNGFEQAKDWVSKLVKCQGRFFDAEIKQMYDIDVYRGVRCVSVSIVLSDGDTTICKDMLITLSSD
ncbi:MAG: hypothetical protein DRN81_05405 [Thermoproteota archaeon]|nr:MAG: hypothetical protein DRN81_05405 [Candidatus Korarchaeota archaeon]